MNYKLIVDKQSRIEPTEEKKEYRIDIEELRVKGNVFDSLVITKDGTYVMRRLSLSEFGVLSILDNPVKEKIKNITIELFEGDNYIYLIDMENNRFHAEYLIKNSFTDIWATREEVNSEINQTADQIELSVNRKLEGYSTTEEVQSFIQVLADKINLQLSKKVGNNEIVTAINMTKEKVKILAKLLQLEGLTTINGGFKIDKEGNASIANDAVVINKKGITLKDGTSIVNADGLYSNLQFIGKGKYGRDFGGAYSCVGFTTVYKGNTTSFTKDDLIIDVSIPEKFIIKKATITLNHTSVNWVGYDDALGKDYDTTGYARRVKLYRTTRNYTTSLTMGGDAEVKGLTSPTEISGAFGTNGYTASQTTLGDVEQKTSIDISSSLKSGMQKLILRSDYTEPTNVTQAASRTGLMYAVLNVYGYLKEI